MTNVREKSRPGPSSVTAKYVAMGYDSANRLASIDTYQNENASANLITHAVYSYNSASYLSGLTYTPANSSTPLAAYYYDYSTAGQVSDLYSRADASGGGTPTTSYVSGGSHWGHAAYGYDSGGQLKSEVYTDFGNAPPNVSNKTYDPNSNRSELGQTITAGNRVTFDGTYYYTCDAEGNRTAKYQNAESPVLDSDATDITLYGWNNRNQMVSLKHYGTYGGTADLDIAYNYDAFNRMTEESDSAGSGLDERYVWDGGDLLAVLDSSGDVTERYLNGPAVDQVLAAEQVGGGNAGVNWLLTDGQQSVRDVVRGVSGGGGLVGEVVDHVIYDAYGRQSVAQSSLDLQEQTRIGFRGQVIDPLAGFTFSGGGLLNSAQGLYYSPDGGWHDAVSQTLLSGADGQDSGAVNPYTVANNAPTMTDLVMRSWAQVSDAPVGIDAVDSGGGSPVYADQNSHTAAQLALQAPGKNPPAPILPNFNNRGWWNWLPPFNQLPWPARRPDNWPAPPPKLPPGLHLAPRPYWVPPWWYPKSLPWPFDKGWAPADGFDQGKWWIPLPALQRGKPWWLPPWLTPWQIPWPNPHIPPLAPPAPAPFAPPAPGVPFGPPPPETPPWVADAI
jgi:hypothetical protein